MQLKQEQGPITKRIPEFPDYEVTKGGAVISHKNPSKPRRLKARLNPTGGQLVTLTDADRNSKACLVHRLVAEAFVPIPKELADRTFAELFVRFKSGTDPYYRNLFWSDRLGPQRSFTPVSDEKAIEMRELHNQGFTVAALIAKFGCSDSYIRDILKGRRKAGATE